MLISGTGHHVGGDPWILTLVYCILPNDLLDWDLRISISRMARYFLSREISYGEDAPFLCGTVLDKRD